jgi:hypothetical protein
MGLQSFRETAVRSAMTDWRLGIREKTHHDEIDRIVKRSGYANRMEWKPNGRAESMWCGMFCACHLLNAGLNKALRPGMWHVKNVENYFTYDYEKRVPKWVTVGGNKMKLKDFHDQVDAPRLWLTHKMIDEMIAEDGVKMVGYADVGLVGPGDILLVDSDRNGTPNHITMVKEYKGGVITTVEGNAGGVINLPGQDGVTKKVKGDAVTLNFRDLSKSKHVAKIYGIGRFSVQDFNRDYKYER